LFGFRADEVQKSLRWITGPKQDAADFQSLISGCAQGRQSEREFTFYRKDGLDVPCFIQMRLSQYDGKNAIRVDFNLLKGHSEQPAIDCCPPVENEKPAQQEFNFSRSQRSVSVSDSGWSDRAGAVNRDLEDRGLDALDPAVFLHMKAVRRAAKAGRREQKRSASQDV
jgi:hypothetical protein